MVLDSALLDIAQRVDTHKIMHFLTPPFSLIRLKPNYEHEMDIDPIICKWTTGLSVSYVFIVDGIPRNKVQLK